jgi:hypothetical protein
LPGFEIAADCPFTPGCDDPSKQVPPGTPLSPPAGSIGCTSGQESEGIFFHCQTAQGFSLVPSQTTLFFPNATSISGVRVFGNTSAAVVHLTVAGLAGISITTEQPTTNLYAILLAGAPAGNPDSLPVYSSFVDAAGNKVLVEDSSTP